MNKKIVLLGVVSLALFSCGKGNKQKKTLSSSELDAKVAQIQNDSKSILDKAKDNEEVTKKLIMKKTDSGAEATQTVSYIGERFTKLVIENKIPASEQLKGAIQQVGKEESEKLLKESFFQSDEMKEVAQLNGFSIDVTLSTEDAYVVTTTYDFTTLDVKKAQKLAYFKDNNIEGLLKITPEQYINNLVQAGATIADK